MSISFPSAVNWAVFESFPSVIINFMGHVTLQKKKKKKEKPDKVA